MPHIDLPRHIENISSYAEYFISLLDDGHFLYSAKYHHTIRQCQAHHFAIGEIKIILIY